jgi:BirA family transcriptional regulator, biotin operon repressor / biotin---[acetyl-CoA-carboxylase] ligase
VLDSLAAPSWLHWLNACSSTNTWALSHRQDLEHGAVVFTQNQTAGRGQAGRTWLAPPGVLTASFILDMAVPQMAGLGLRVGLAVITAVEALVPVLEGQLRLKWPNDVLVGQRKLAGILCEATSGSAAGASQAVLGRVVVGVGLNRWVDFRNFNEAELALGQRAISLHQLSTQVPTELELLTTLRQTLLALDQRGLAADLPQLQARDALYGANLRFAPTDVAEPLIGQGAGLNAHGQLLIRLRSDEVRAFTSGRILEWHPQPYA